MDRPRRIQRARVAARKARVTAWTSRAGFATAHAAVARVLEKDAIETAAKVARTEAVLVG